MNTDISNEKVLKVSNYKLQSILESPNYSLIKVNPITTYYPLLLIIIIISLIALKSANNVHDWMLHFMAGFYIAFGSFKLLDLKGFKKSYASYDLLAKRWNNYGLVYPFLELGLGFAFLFKFELHLTIWLSITLMTFSSLGVIKAITSKQKISCACLGTVINLPMSSITLIEDLGMVIMSIIMLI